MPANGNYATKSDLKELRDELIEAIHDAETKLLKAFYAFAETNQQRHTNLERSTNGLAERLATLERRVMDLEKKVNFPNAP
jgi:chromosome segregation ATPase